MLLSASDVKRQLQAVGLSFGLSAQKLDKQLEAAMGKSRFQDYLAVLDHCRSSGRGQAPVYEFAGSLHEANLLMSHQAELTLETALWALRRLEATVRPGDTLVDLGCWTGALSHVLATQFPACTIVGIDRIPRVVDWARSRASSLPNLHFECWDYAKTDGHPDLRAAALVSSLGIDIPEVPVPCSLDANALRNSQEYTSKRAALSPYLASWRAIATDRAQLYAVLRLSEVEHLLAFADAAHEHGWRIRLEESVHIIEEDKSTPGRIPALSLAAGAAKGPLTEDDAASWIGFDEAATLDARGARAVAIYRSFGQKTVTSRRSKTYAGDGNTMSAEVGRVGGIGYLFVRATTGYAELRMGSTVDVDNLEPSMGWGAFD